MSARPNVGPDIDLDVEVVRDNKGDRITEARAKEIAAAALQQAGVGRPPLTAPGRRSPEVKARCRSSCATGCTPLRSGAGSAHQSSYARGSTGTWSRSGRRGRPGGDHPRATGRAGQGRRRADRPQL